MVAAETLTSSRELAGGRGRLSSGPLFLPSSCCWQSTPIPVPLLPGRRGQSACFAFQVGKCRIQGAEGQQALAQVVGSLPPLWETWIEFLALGFSLAQLWLLQASWE